MAFLPTGGLKDALSVLTALITPAILILASSGLASSTASRLASITARTREVFDAYRRLNEQRAEGLHPTESETLSRDVTRATRRSRLLQRALYAQYLAIMVFIATSAGLGVSALWFRSLAWVWILSALVGAGVLLYSALLLVIDSRIGISAVEAEMLMLLRQSGLQKTTPSLAERLRRLRDG